MGESASVLGANGFEPPCCGIKIHCFTTWGHPNRTSGKRRTTTAIVPLQLASAAPTPGCDQQPTPHPDSGVDCASNDRGFSLGRCPTILNPRHPDTRRTSSSLRPRLGFRYTARHLGCWRRHERASQLWPICSPQVSGNRHQQDNSTVPGITLIVIQRGNHIGPAWHP
jgi:hypothetical protein